MLFWSHSLGSSSQHLKALYTHHSPACKGGAGVGKKVLITTLFCTKIKSEPLPPLHPQTRPHSLLSARRSQDHGSPLCPSPSDPGTPVPAEPKKDGSQPAQGL